MASVLPVIIVKTIGHILQCVHVCACSMCVCVLCVCVVGSLIWPCPLFFHRETNHTAVMRSRGLGRYNPSFHPCLPGTHTARQAALCLPSCSPLVSPLCSNPMRVMEVMELPHYLTVTHVMTIAAHLVPSYTPFLFPVLLH
jgi:hypothetical protein